MSTPTLQKALQDDALEIAEVYMRARNAAFPFIPPYVHTDDEVREWMTSIVIPIQDTWVAKTEEYEIVAMISLDNGH